MQAFVLFLLASFLIGGTRLGAPARRWPILMIAFCTLAAASFSSLRVVL